VLPSNYEYANPEKGTVVREVQTTTLCSIALFLLLQLLAQFSAVLNIRITSSYAFRPYDRPLIKCLKKQGGIHTHVLNHKIFSEFVHWEYNLVLELSKPEHKEDVPVCH